MKVLAPLVLSCALALAGCATLSSPASAPRTPAQTVYAVEGTYAAALTVAVQYRQLPDCSTGAPICSDAATIAKVRAADAAAWSSILTAQDAVRGGLTTAQISQTATQAASAVNAFYALTQALKVK